MDRNIIKCAECLSEYLKDSSEMSGLCPECSSKLYGFKNCVHVFINGKCSKCYWDGKVSNYLKQ